MNCLSVIIFCMGALSCFVFWPLGVIIMLFALVIKK